MIEQTYYLDMIPGESAPPVVHVSQFDVNSRTLTFNLMKGGVAYEPDIGMTVTLDGTKPDNTAFSYPMTVDGSSVSIALQPQMTVVSGHVRCEVTVSNASGQIGSANFILAVEESAIDTGAISDTDIPIFEDLKNQAQQAAAEATAAAQTVSAILPENVGTVGQVLTRTGTGAAWDDVDGLPAGGTVGQVLTKQSSTDGDADWETPASGGTWGSITGTLSNQTDLQNALDAKSNIGNIATIESSPASANHAVGEFIVYNGQMYSVISAITAGNALVVGTNISATSAGDELSSLKAGLTNVTSELTVVEQAVTVNGGGGATGSGFIRVYGRVVTLTLQLNYPSTGTNLRLAWLTGQSNNPYKPVRDIWLSCDYYSSTGSKAEAQIRPDGGIFVNQPEGGKDLKISGAWVY